LIEETNNLRDALESAVFSTLLLTLTGTGHATFTEKLFFYHNAPFP